MELYLLITGVVTLVGVIIIVVYLEQASRKGMERFKREREDALLQLQSLAAIHSLIQNTQGQANTILAALQSANEQSILLLNTQEANSAKRAETAIDTQSKKIQEIQNSLKEKAEAISTGLNTLNTNLKAGLDALCKMESENAQQLRQSVNDSARQIQSLKSSLEESIKF